MVERIEVNIADTEYQLGSGKEIAQVVLDFHNLFYHAQLWKTVDWMGIHVAKNPLDLWIYQEIIYQTKPDVIIETGTLFGGSALFLANMLDNVKGNWGRVVSIDNKIPEESLPDHPKITYLTGNSIDPTIAAWIKTDTAYNYNQKTMVILDSDHSKEHVLKEMLLYQGLVSPGCYLIVEDTNLNGHPIFTNGVEGPWEAVQEFLAKNNDFEIDHGRGKFGMTFNPGGYLRKKEKVEEDKI